MAEKYCIASGVFTNTAIWSDTDGGAGGAAVPARGDDIYLNQAVTITQFRLDLQQNVYVGEGVDGSLAPSSGLIKCQDDKSVVVNGTLRMADTIVGVKYISATTNVTGGNIVIGKNGRLDLAAPGSAWIVLQDGKGATSVENDGVIVGGRIRSIFAPEPCGTLRPGITEILEVQNASSPLVGFRTIEDDFETSFFTIQTSQKNTTSTLTVLSGKAKIKDLRFELFGSNVILVLEQHGNWEISGNISRDIREINFEWRMLDGATLALVGAGDQSVDMSTRISGQTWLADKSGGMLDLTQFNGFLQGRVKNLTVRAASNISLAGDSPTLVDSAGESALFSGLKANACSAEQLQLLSWDGVREFESMDSCINYGQITIPAGKTLCCKTFDNQTGAAVLGEGVLCVEYGGLTDAGSVASTITIQYFNAPRSPLTDLTVSPSSGEAPLTVTASVTSDPGTLHTFKWGNGLVTGPTESTSSGHTYTTPGTYTVTVTTTDADENEWSLSQTVTVLTPPPLPQARLSVTPGQGEIPLDVELSTEGSEGTEMTIDWGDGSPLYGPLAGIAATVSHRYEIAGRFLAKLRVGNASGNVAEASQVINVQGPGGLLAELVLSPSDGVAPLTVLADATGSTGDEFLFAWGDGSSDGPQSEPAATHTFARSGHYSVVMTTAKGNATASAVRGVTVRPNSTSTDPSPSEPVTSKEKEEPCGISRDDRPSLYRLALSQGICYMNDTIRLFCPMTKNGRALHHGSALFLGRIMHFDASPVIPDEIESAGYSICRLDESDAAVRVPIEGHTDVPLEIGNVLLSELKTDENWPFDAVGYNFRYVLDDSTHSPFPVPGRHYLVTFVLSPLDASPKIRIEYRVHVI